MRKKLLVLFAFVSLLSAQFLPAGSAFARSNPHSVYVHGYYRHNGTYVKGYHRTVANHTKLDNYSHKGNYNPWTRKYGTRR